MERESNEQSTGFKDRRKDIRGERSACLTTSGTNPNVEKETELLGNDHKLNVVWKN
jgi:hypothetical protein